MRYQPPAQPHDDKITDPDTFVLRVPLADRRARASLMAAAQAMAELEQMVAQRDNYRADDVKVASGKPSSKEPGNRHAAGALRRACRMLDRIPPIVSELADRLDQSRDRTDGKLPAVQDDAPAVPGRPSSQAQAVGGISREVRQIVAKAERMGVLPAPSK